MAVDRREDIEAPVTRYEYEYDNQHRIVKVHHVNRTNIKTTTYFYNQERDAHRINLFGNYERVIENNPQGWINRRVYDHLGRLNQEVDLEDGNNNLMM